MADGKPGRPTAQEQEDREFIGEFNELRGEAELQGYEEANRDRIAGASLVTRDVFNRHWDDVFGKPYWQPVTVAPKRDESPALSGGGRVDPASMDYKGFWEVIFSAKSNPDDQDDVTLGLNGAVLQIQRSQAVIVPGPYLEVADHGRFPKYTQTPEESRKITAWIQFFPYTVLRTATEAEYNAMKTKGDKTTRDAREREESLIARQ